MSDTEMLIFHAPIETDIVVHIINDDTGQRAKATYTIMPAEIPDQQAIADALKRFEEGVMRRDMPGYRLMTKREFWDSICQEKTGECGFALPGGEDWTPLT